MTAGSRTHGFIIPQSTTPAVLKKLRAQTNETQRAVRQAWFRVGDQLKRKANEQILHGPKTGRVYRLRQGRRFKRHQSSAPGESPANFSGTYRKSIGYEIKGWQQLEFGAGRDMNKLYPKFLEEGTSKMEPRPGLGNALFSEQQEIVKIFSDEIQKRLG